MEYDLYLRVDSNTSGHRQWFYFAMKNEKKGRIKLNLYRFRKQYSLFQRGMRPYVRSRKAGKDWAPAGEHVVYRCERQRNEYGVKKEVKSFVLTFYYHFEHENDEVFVAAGIPYSYSFLQKQLSYLQGEMGKRENVSLEVGNLCRSMCGLDLPLITVQHKKARIASEARKKFIIINARTHSGESSSSWVLDGLLMELTQSIQVEKWLLQENICLKIVPMLNPDGVFIGNYRTGIIGDDFNRRFHSGRKEFYPEIHALKKLVSQCKKDGIIELFFDLHGHSILKNSFIYGPSISDSARFKMSSLPNLLWHNTSKYFRLASCKFKTDKESVETARGFFQMKEDILTFTCENSLGLFFNQGQTFQMLAGDWHAFGKAVLHSFVDCFSSKAHITQSHREIPTPKHIQRSTESPKAKMTVDTSKASRNQKFLRERIASTNKHSNSNFIERLDLSDNNTVSFSDQVNREDQILQSKQFSYNEKSSKQGLREGKERGRSQAIKPPAGKLIQSIINKNKLRELQRKYSGDYKIPVHLGRSSTYDTSQTLNREEPQYEMEVINENFSDEYVSINDSDSQGENLPEQERNYLLDYIKTNQHKLSNEEDQQRSNSEKEEKSKPIEPKEPKISGFREIRFKSIEEVYASEVNIKEAARGYAKKLKLQPHKFKDSTSKTLIYKQTGVLQHEFDDPTLVTFSQQKQLNERNRQRRTQKDPFVLFQRKEKLQRLLERE